MSERRLRALAIVSHPIQYAVPVFRLMAQDPQLDFQVAYCTLRGAEAAHDPEFGRSVQWDVPLLDGYKWTHVPNQGSGGESFFGLFNPGLWKLIREGHFDAVLCQLGYVRCSFWISYFGARGRGTPFMFLTDASSMEARDGRRWKFWLKKLAWPVLFRMFSQVLTASSAGSEMMRSLRIPERKITMTLDTVDNDWWRAEAARLNRSAVRASWGLDNAEKIVLFCAKLQPWKRPLDLLRAFAAAEIPRSTLLFAGDGPLRASIEAEASALGLGQRVRVLGFVNQSQLPAVYRASDIMVIPSEYEPFGLVVNEAMLCGCVVIASDRVGAVRDLIFPGRTGYVYPCGDTRALATTLRHASADPSKLADIGLAAGRRIAEWSPRASAAAMTEVIVRAAGSTQVSRRGNGDAVDSAFNADRYLPS
jgi:glycosyltransferase involved in cell wall biosynthesis